MFMVSPASPAILVSCPDPVGAGHETTAILDKRRHHDNYTQNGEFPATGRTCTLLSLEKVLTLV